MIAIFFILPFVLLICRSFSSEKKQKIQLITWEWRTPKDLCLRFQHHAKLFRKNNLTIIQFLSTLVQLISNNTTLMFNLKLKIKKAKWFSSTSHWKFHLDHWIVLCKEQRQIANLYHEKKNIFFSERVTMGIIIVSFVLSKKNKRKKIHMCDVSFLHLFHKQSAWSTITKVFVKRKHAILQVEKRIISTCKYMCRSSLNERCVWIILSLFMFSLFQSSNHYVFSSN